MSESDKKRGIGDAQHNRPSPPPSAFASHQARADYDAAKAAQLAAQKAAAAARKKSS